MLNFIKQKTNTLVMYWATDYVLIFFIFIAAIFYVYFAGTAVRTLTVLEKTKGQTQSLSMKVSEMESKRLAIENNFSTDRALALGFIEVERPVFIMKNSGKTTLSYKID